MGNADTEKYYVAGEKLRDILKATANMVREGVKVLEICEWSEKMIREAGFKPAFPTNISIGSTAAHYTSPPKDSLVIGPTDIVKVDMGLHIDGCIVDSAVTVCLDDRLSILVEAAMTALERVERILKPGLRVGRIGEVIYSTVRSFNLKVIENLSGHKIEKYKIHGASIPNVPTFGGYKLKEGDVIAIEPFTTMNWGAGRVMDGKESYIFMYRRDIKASGDAEKLLELSRDEYMRLPFCERWVTGLDFKKALKVLLKKNALYEFPVLVEVKGAPIAQAEHTFLVLKDGAAKLTGD